MSQTLQNLNKAFIGESQARNRYSFYAKTAQKEGLDQIAEIFLLTAENEREHAKQSFKLINELKEKGNIAEYIKVEAACPSVFADTKTNLRASIEGEGYEHTSMYPEFADIAEKEGYDEIAARLRAIGKAEEHHKERFEKLLNGLENGTLFKKEKATDWLCRKCGYVHTGVTPPEKCPSCGHPANYFEVKCEEY